jgi:hypothetical protein
MSPERRATKPLFLRRYFQSFWLAHFAVCRQVAIRAHVARAAVKGEARRGIRWTARIEQMVRKVWDMDRRSLFSNANDCSWREADIGIP